MEAPAPLRGAQPLVELQKLLADIFDNVLADFIQLSLPEPAGQSDRESADQRKHRLLLHLHGTRQQLLRALALLNWKPWRVLNELVDHDRVLDIAASHVRTMMEVVGQMRQQAAGRIMAGSYLNMYDVNTALEVLTTGTYQELPSIILHRPPLFQPPPASLARQRSRLAHVTQLIRSRLVQVPLPPGLKVVGVNNGTAVLRAEGLYEVKLTLVPSESLLGVDAAEDAAAAGPGPSRPQAAAGSGLDPDLGTGWAAAAATAAADPAAAAAAAQRWKWRLIHFVLLIGVPFYDPRQPGQILNTCNFHMVLAADNAAYLRRQRQASGGAAATAGGAASTLSESAATPAASGLPHAGGAAGAGGGGGSLAAAVRRAEDDEVGAPLAVMHAILTDVAGRLLADELAAAARELAAPGSRWHGHITVKPSQLLHPGVRIEYWVQAPPLLRQGALPSAAASVAGGEVDLRAVKPGPPYLELGMGEGGCVEVLHAPSSVHKPVAVSKLRLDTFRMNVEEVLMRAANMSSQFQLLQIRSELKGSLVEAMGKRAPTLRLTTLARQLWCRDGNAPQQPDTEEEGEAEGAGAGTGAAEGGGVRDTQEGEQAEQEEGEQGPEGGEAAAAAGLRRTQRRRDAAKVAPMEIDSQAAATADGAAAATPAGAGAASGGTGREPASVGAETGVISPPTAPAPEVSGLLARAAPPEESAGALVLLNAPVLEYLVSGTTELKIGKHLFSGRLTLRPGQDERDEGSLDHAATIAMHEDYVNQAALTAYNSASAEGYPGWRALREACAALSHVLQRTHTSTDATHFIQAARRAALHISRLPHGLIDTFTAASPGLAIEPRPREKVATWALQCVPFPPNFPPLEPVTADTLPLRVPQCLSFFLQSRLSLASPHVLVVCSCNKQLMPVKVLSCIPVPPSTYRLPDHVLAAFMAASTSGGNHHPNHHHSSGGGVAAAAAAGAGHHQQQHPAQPQPQPQVQAQAQPHSPQPHSGANSPRTLPNGLEAGPRSPAASPVPDSMGHGSLGTSAAAAAAAISGGGAGSEAGACPGSAVPSLPSASSPPHSHTKAFSSGGPHSQHQHQQEQQGRGGAGPSGRPTGQQVAVMLAQQQLSRVVRWCRRRMVWEVLLVQLQAVGATFEELCGPPCQRLRVTRVAGTALPCSIARRRGLTPQRIGPRCLELELGPDALAGQVTARLYGRFLCSPACSPVAAAAGAGAGATSEYVRESATSSTATTTSGGSGVAGGAGGGGGGAAEAGMVCLRRQYCLERGDSALTIVQEVCAVIRMQTLLARLEMTAHPHTTNVLVGANGAAAVGTPAAVAAAAATSPAASGCRLQAQRLAVLAPPAPPPPAPSLGPANGTGLGYGYGGQRHRSTARFPESHSAASLLPNHNYQHSNHHNHLGHAHAGMPSQAADGASHPHLMAGPAGGCHVKREHGAGPGGGGGGGGYDPHGHSAKRIKTEPGSPAADGAANGCWGAGQVWQKQAGGAHEGLGHYAGALANGGLPQGAAGGGGAQSSAAKPASGAAGGFIEGGAGGLGAAAAPPGLTWHWPLVGTLTLEAYSCSAATIRVTPWPAQPPGSASPGPVGAGSGDGSAAATAVPPPPLQLHVTWAPRDVRHLHGSAAASPPNSPAPTPGGGGSWAASPGGPAATATPVACAPSPYVAPTPGPGGAAGGPPPPPSGLLPPNAVVTTSRNVLCRPGDAFGSQFSDLVLCTVLCSSGHPLPSEYLHVLEEFAEAGEEGKLLDAVAVAAWPLAGLCSSLRPAVLSRYGLSPDSDVRLTLNQPPYCHRIVCKRRGPAGSGSTSVVIDLVCQAVGRSYLRISVTSPPPGQQQQQQPPGQQQQQDAAAGAGASLERQSMTGGPVVKAESGALGGGAGGGGGVDGIGAQPVLRALQALAPARLGSRVCVSVGGRAAMYSGLGPRPALVPGPGAPLWLLVPNDCVQQAVELVFSVLQ